MDPSNLLYSYDPGDRYDNFSVFVFDCKDRESNHSLGVLLAILTPFYSGVVCFLFTRRHYQPLKSRGANLILISIIGNQLFTNTLIINKIIANVYKVGSFFECKCCFEL
jgi:hypothetical protein